jgi:hypothetical protein
MGAIKDHAPLKLPPKNQAGSPVYSHSSHFGIRISFGFRFSDFGFATARFGSADFRSGAPG